MVDYGEELVDTATLMYLLFESAAEADVRFAGGVEFVYIQVSESFGSRDGLRA